MPPRKLDRSDLMPAMTRLRLAIGDDEEAQAVLKAIVFYVGRLEMAIDAHGAWADV